MAKRPSLWKLIHVHWQYTIVLVHSFKMFSFQDIGEYVPAENQVLHTELVQVTSKKSAKTLPYFTKRSLVIEGRGSNLVNYID